MSLSQDSILSLISCCLGICSVVLASRRNILTFAFGFGQVLTYTYLCWTQRFYGEIAINVYYFATMIYGVYVWRKRLKVESGKMKVEPRSLSPIVIGLIIVTTLLGSWLVGWGCTCGAGTDDTRLSRALVHMARCRYPVRHPLGARRGLVHGDAVRDMVRQLHLRHFHLEPIRYHFFFEEALISSAGFALVCGTAK